MDIKHLFGTQLADEEMYSSDDHGGGYPLHRKSIWFGMDKIATTNPVEVTFFSDEVKAELAEIYGQVFMMKYMWELHPGADTLILEDAWLKSEYLDRGYDLPSMREELGGMLHVLPLDELLHDKAHVFWLNDNLETYFPFDVHFNLTACLKKVNGTVKNNIYIYHNRIPKVFDMKVTLSEYLMLAYQAKCFYNWQMAYINRAGMDWEKMRRMLPKILPNLALDLHAFGM